MRLGLKGGLGLCPAEFWALTPPVELMMMLGQEGGGSAPPLGRARLEQLARAFPDVDPDTDPDIAPGLNEGE